MFKVIIRYNISSYVYVCTYHISLQIVRILISCLYSYAEIKIDALSYEKRG